MAETEKYFQSKIIAFIILTVVVFFIEIVVGLASGSTTLVADSFHMLSDVVAMVIALASVKLARQTKRTTSNTYGWARAEDLGALVNSVFLCALCFTIIIQAIQRIAEPERINNPWLVLMVGCLGLVVNVIGLVIFHSHKETDTGQVSKAESPVAYFRSIGSNESFNTKRNRQRRLLMSSGAGQKSSLSDKSVNADKKTSSANNTVKTEVITTRNEEPAKQVSSANHEGIFLHILADFIGSIIVLISALVILWWPHVHGLVYLDPVLSLVSASLIIWSTKPLLTRSASVLLQTVPEHIDIEQLERDFLKQVPSAIAIHDFHVWQLTGETIIATTHVVCEATDQFSHSQYMHDIETMKNFFHKHDVHSTTIQIEYKTRRVTTPQTKDGKSSASTTPANVIGKEHARCAVPCDNVKAKNKICCPIEDPEGATRSLIEADKSKHNHSLAPKLVLKASNNLHNKIT